MRAQASCQPTFARDGWLFQSNRSPDSEVRSIPPTNATRSSTTIVFSWWQCIGRSFESSAHWIFDSPTRRSRISRTSLREGRKSGNGAPAHTSTRTSTRSASSASRLRSTIGSPSRSSAKSGEKCQPVRWTCDLVERNASAIAGSACAPSMRISIAFPGRGGVPSSAHPPAVGSSASDRPIRARRRR